MAVSLRIVGYQCLFLALITAVLWFISPQHSVAALIAGVACIVPNAYFAWSAERATNPYRLMGQSGAKIALTITLLAVAFSVYKPQPLGFFVTFIGLQLVHMFAGLLVTRSNEERY